MHPLIYSLGRIVDHWNKLPDDIVSAATISTFKRRLDLDGQIWALKADSLTSPLIVTETVTSHFAPMSTRPTNLHQVGAKCEQLTRTRPTDTKSKQRNDNVYSKQESHAVAGKSRNVAVNSDRYQVCWHFAGAISAGVL